MGETAIQRKGAMWKFRLSDSHRKVWQASYLSYVPYANSILLTQGVKNERGNAYEQKRKQSRAAYFQGIAA